MDPRYDRCAPDCEDQLPILAPMGIGPEGDGFYVRIYSDDIAETHLEGQSVDGATGEFISEWITKNINGGQLSYYYKLRPYTIPQTFTMTFVYRRPGREEWSWTTPAIPYVWSSDEAGEKEDPDHIVGSGVATLYIRKTTETAWTEKLVYPDGTTGEDFNTPDAEEPWTVNLSFGIGGDVDVPNIDDLAKVLGITVEDIRNIINGNTITIGGTADVKNIVDYIDKQDDSVLKHFHKDLGFNNPDHAETGAFGGYDTVKAYIDAQIESIENMYKKSLADILSKVYAGGTLNEDGSITWPNDAKIAIGDLNIYGNAGEGDVYVNTIRTRAANTDNDVKVN